MIVVRPLVKDRELTRELFPQDLQSKLHPLLNKTSLPSVFYATDTETGEVACTAISYRRTSYQAQFEFCYGDRSDLISASIKGALAQCHLEGRKTVHTYSENPHYSLSLDSSQFLPAGSLLVHENQRQVFDWTLLHEGSVFIPSEVFLVVSTNETVDGYFAWNTKLYQGDTVESTLSVPFSHVLELARDHILNHPQVYVEKNWASRLGSENSTR